MDVVSFGVCDHAPKGADIVLMGRMLKDGCERDDLRYLFPALVSPPPGWETRTAIATRYTHFAATAARAQALRLNHWVKSWISARKPTRPEVAPIPTRVDPASAPSKPRLKIAN
jgi:hypothetical protein